VNKYLIYFSIVTLFILGCAAKIGKQPTMPIDSAATTESGTAVSIPVNIADPSFITTLIAFLVVAVVAFGALAILGIAMWQKNSRGSRRRWEKKKNDS